ncbi:MAG: sensor histidine kinase [Acidimicrobiia bacterium]
MNAPTPLPATPDEHGARRRPHLNVRWRLALWFTALFFVVSVVLLALNYVLVDHSLSQNPDEIRTAVAEQLGISPSAVRTSEKGELPDADDRSVFREVQRKVADEHLEHLLTESGVALAVMTIVSFGLAWLIAGRVLRPVHRMTRTARRLSESNLHERIALDGPDDELKELADTFDAMLSRLESAFESQRRFVADASHELRTPLAIIRAEVDVTLADPDATPAELRAMAETVRGATRRTETLIDSLLVLARSDAAGLVTEPVDLADLARSASERMAAGATTRHLEIEQELHPAIVTGDHSLLERLVGNLVENAVQHNIDLGWIMIETGQAGGVASLRVANSGIQIDPADVDELFGRFHRGEDTRTRGTPGFGLGLSIVAAVATAHGGRVHAEPLPAGGLAVTVELVAAGVATTPDAPTLAPPPLAREKLRGGAP